MTGSSSLPKFQNFPLITFPSPMPNNDEFTRTTLHELLATIDADLYVMNLYCAT